MAKKTWRQKYETSAEPHIDTMSKSMWGVSAGAKLLISTPKELEAEVRKIAPGNTRRPEEIRADLADRHGADATCPLTTGIFLRIIAEVALEDLAAGAPLEDVAPFWRVVDPKSPLAKKLSCGPEFIQNRRLAESAQ